MPSNQESPHHTPSAPSLNLPSAASTVLVFIFSFLCFFFLWVYCSWCTAAGGRSVTTLRGRRIMLQMQQLRRHDRVGSPDDRPHHPTSSLPSVPYASLVEGAKNPGDDCAVCLSGFEMEEEVKVIPACGHVFHAQCIDRWLVLHDSCPVCRCTGILTGEVVEVSSGSSTSSSVAEVEVVEILDSGGEEDLDVVVVELRGRRHEDEEEEMGSGSLGRPRRSNSI